jgi:hypothetical protein
MFNSAPFLKIISVTITKSDVYLLELLTDYVFLAGIRPLDYVLLADNYNYKQSFLAEFVINFTNSIIEDKIIDFE